MFHGTIWPEIAGEAHALARKILVLKNGSRRSADVQSPNRAIICNGKDDLTVRFFKRQVDLAGHRVDAFQQDVDEDLLNTDPAALNTHTAYRANDGQQNPRHRQCAATSLRRDETRCNGTGNASTSAR